MKPKQVEMFETNKPVEPIRIFTDGAGANLDGKGSGYAFHRTDTGENKVIRKDGLTSNQAEYGGVILALECLLGGEVAEICTDSELIYAQLTGIYKVRDPHLFSLCESVNEIIRRKCLVVTFVRVPREENLAGKLL